LLAAAEVQQVTAAEAQEAAAEAFKEQTEASLAQAAEEHSLLVATAETAKPVFRREQLFKAA
jgi:hypothetical protein